MSHGYIYMIPAPNFPSQSEMISIEVPMDIPEDRILQVQTRSRGTINAIIPTGYREGDILEANITNPMGDIIYEFVEELQILENETMDSIDNGIDSQNEIQDNYNHRRIDISSHFKGYLESINAPNLITIPMENEIELPNGNRSASISIPINNQMNVPISTISLEKLIRQGLDEQYKDKEIRIYSYYEWEGFSKGFSGFDELIPIVDIYHVTDSGDGSLKQYQNRFFIYELLDTNYVLKEEDRVLSSSFIDEEYESRINELQRLLDGDITHLEPHPSESRIYSPIDRSRMSDSSSDDGTYSSDTSTPLDDILTRIENLENQARESHEFASELDREGDSQSAVTTRHWANEYEEEARVLREQLDQDDLASLTPEWVPQFESSDDSDEYTEDPPPGLVSPSGGNNCRSKRKYKKKSKRKYRNRSKSK